ncbi:MAG TPA: hemerythrin domain-containing protein [Burkholderiales bacterium]
MKQAVVRLEERRERIQAAAEGRRVDLYTTIHKGLRTFMARTLEAVGRMDAADVEDVAQTLAQLRALLGLMRTHMHAENQFLHPALEARRPGAARRTAGEHVEHEHAFEELHSAILALERADRPARAGAATLLYRRLALFVGENLEHMHFEETENNALLWAAYSDAELAGIHDALLASIAPDERALALHWMLPALNAAERAGMLTELQGKLPAAAFAGLLAGLRPALSVRDWGKLTAALGPVSSSN